MPIKRNTNKRTKKVKPKEIHKSRENTVKKPCLVKFTSVHDVQDQITSNRKKGHLTKVHPPFSKLKSSPIRKKNYSKSSAFKSKFRSVGLSSKEKSYIISNLQSRTSRYSKLKELADRAKRESKVFSIYGSCNAVRKALLQRGWVEKIPPNRMNLAKINNGTISSKADIYNELERLMLSNLVEKCNPNFVWRETQQDYDTTIDMKKECKTIVNKLKTDALWTTKQGLCMSMKINYWFYIEDVAEVVCPRTYNSYDSGEVDEFVTDYRITACTSLIQWVISMLADKKIVFAEHGTIPITVMTFALNRCEEYIFYKRNKDIDHPIKMVNTKQWNAFLKKYYRLITNSEVFELDKVNKFPKYLTYAKILLQKFYKYRPQLSCEGYRNIWIIKPAHCSRGRGIRMASKLGVITDLLTKANAKYVVQKYIEKPLLIHETKFDIRQYYLVTSTYPLVIWMYRDCYLKFSSQKYNLENYHESIHLTNNAVQRKYNNYFGRHSELPDNNMWELDTYKNYLSKIGLDGVWEHIIYPGMKKSIIGIMLSCQDSLPFCKNRFELYGCDFLLDEEYTPWLIEINSCPDLTNTTEVTAKICPAVVDDIIKVVIDSMGDPKASTGKFECIYQQPMTVPKFSSSTELSVRGIPLSNDYFYRGTLPINQLSNFTASNDEIDNEIFFMSKSLFGKDSIIDVSKHKWNTLEEDTSGKHLNDEKNPIVPKLCPLPKSVSILNAPALRTGFQPAKMCSVTKECLNHSQTSSSLTTISALLNEFDKRVSTECNNRTSKYCQCESRSENIDTKDMVRLVQSYIKNSSKPQIKMKLPIKPKDYILQATPEITSFFNEKEKEYNANFKRPIMTMQF